MAVLLLAVFLLGCGEKGPPPKAEAEELMISMVPVAEELLEKAGKFEPFAGVIPEEKPEEIMIIAPFSGKDNLPQQSMIDQLKQRLQQNAAQYRVTAMVYQAQIVSATGQPQDAIAVALDHVEGYSAVLVVPYTKTDQKIEIGEPLGQEGSYEIFGKN